MNILQVISSARTSGAERHMVVLSERLRRRGHTVAAVCPPGGWITTKLAAAQVPTLEWRMHGLIAPAVVGRLRSYVRDHRIDLIHTHLTRATYMGYFAGLLSGVPVVSTVHTLTRDWAYRYLPSRNHWFIAVSNHLHQALMTRGVPEPRIRVVYNGTDFEPYAAPTTHAREVRQELGLEDSADLIGVFGRVDEFKGQHVLVKAARAIVTACPRVRLVFVGLADAGVEQGLRALAETDGVEGRLLFTGIRDDVPRLMDAMDVIALPSRTEACSMAIIEAMMMGKPVVATRAGGNPELIEDGRTGILADRTPEAFAQAAILLCLDRTKRARMGDASRERALRLFTADGMAANTESMYEEVLAAKAGNGP